MAPRNQRKSCAFDEVFAPFEQDAEYQKEKRKLKPYYDLVVQIIQLRERMNLTQKDLAARVNISQARISQIESAECDVRLSTLVQIAEALDAEVSVHLIPQQPERAEHGHNATLAYGTELVHTQVLPLAGAIDDTIANWIVAQVDRLGLRHDNDFESFGVVMRPWYSRVKNKKILPSMRTVVRFCVKAGISFDDFAAGMGIHQAQALVQPDSPNVTLHLLREQAGLSMRKLVGKTGISHAEIMKIEKSIIRERIRLRTIVLLDQALNANGALLASFWYYYANDILDAD
ncbi:MAG TPA: helix-turn-helix transcriptional regulator [Anaerolineales bacterium]|nr:helix-turn-helix transcriptional regulator [Anaerolineales bacterium]